MKSVPFFLKNIVIGSVCLWSAPLLAGAETQEAFLSVVSSAWNNIKKETSSAYHFFKWIINSTGKTPSETLSEMSSFVSMTIHHQVEDHINGVTNEDYPPWTLQELA